MKIMTEYGLTIKSRGNIKAMKSDNEENPHWKSLLEEVQDLRNEGILPVCSRCS